MELSTEKKSHGEQKTQTKYTPGDETDTHTYKTHKKHKTKK